MWALNIFALELGMTIISCLIIYVLWRIYHPGRKW